MAGFLAMRRCPPGRCARRLGPATTAGRVRIEGSYAKPSESGSARAGCSGTRGANPDKLETRWIERLSAGRYVNLRIVAARARRGAVSVL